MKKNKRYVQFVLLAGFMILPFLCSTVGYAAEVRGVTSDTIKVGVILDVTGPAALTGINYVEGIRNYFRYVNEKGGIHGRKVKVIHEDDHYSIPIAIAAFKKLVFKDKVLAILGCGGTGQTTSLLSQIEKQRMPVITLSQAEKMVIPYRRYVFIPAATYEDQIRVMVDYVIKDLGVKDPRIAMVYPDNEFGKTARDATKKRVEEYGIKLVRQEVLGMGAVDATSQVLGLKRARANYIIIQDTVGATVALLKNAKRFGYKSTFIGIHSCSDDTVRVAKGAAKNFIGAYNFAFWHDNVPGMTQMKEITMKYSPGSKPRMTYYTAGWVTSMECAEAARIAGKDLNGESLIKGMEKIKGFSTGGLTGTVSFSSKSHRATESTKIRKADVEKGIMVPIADWRKPVSLK